MQTLNFSVIGQVWMEEVNMFQISRLEPQKINKKQKLHRTSGAHTEFYLQTGYLLI